MLTFYNNLSPTTRLVIQSFLSVLGSVLAGVVAAAYQSYTQAGHLDLQGLLNISLLTFALLFGKAMHDWVPAHAQQLIQSVQQEKSALYNALQTQRGATATPTLDVPSLASALVQHLDLSQLAGLLRDEMIKSNRSPIPPRPQAPDMATAPQMQVVRTNTPPLNATTNFGPQPIIFPQQPNRGGG